MKDPFADEEVVVQVEEVPVVERVVNEGQNGASKIVTTYKEGSSYDSSWVVVHANSLEEAKGLLTQEFADYLKEVKKVASFFRGGSTPAAAPAAGVRQSAPQPAQEAPGGESRSCSHGQMKFMSGFAKASGKPYKGFFCPSPDRGSQCKPVFLP